MEAPQVQACHPPVEVRSPASPSWLPPSCGRSPHLLSGRWPRACGHLLEAQPYILPDEALEARRPGPRSQTPFGVLLLHPGGKGGGRSHLDTGRVPGEGTTVSLGQEGLLSRKCSHHWDRVLGYRVHVGWVGIGFSKSWWALTCPVGDPRRTWGEYPACCWLMPPRW